MGHPAGERKEVLDLYPICEPAGWCLGCWHLGVPFVLWLSWKRGSVATIPGESPLGCILDQDLSTALNPRVRGGGRGTCQYPHWGLGRVSLGPCAPRTATLAALIISLRSPVLLGYVKLQDQTRVYLGFCLFFGLLLFGAVCPLTAKSVLWYLTFIDIKCGEKEENLSVFVQEWDILRRGRVGS